MAIKHGSKNYARDVLTLWLAPTLTRKRRMPMTIDQLEQENQVLREVIFDLEKQIKCYRIWIDKNNSAIAEELEGMVASEGC